jgi:hypothetical protein
VHDWRAGSRPRSSPSRRRSRTRRGAGMPRGWQAPGASGLHRRRRLPESDSLAALTIASHLLRDVAEGDLDASGHAPSA